MLAILKTFLETEVPSAPFWFIAMIYSLRISSFAVNFGHVIQTQSLLILCTTNK